MRDGAGNVRVIQRKRPFWHMVGREALIGKSGWMAGIEAQRVYVYGGVVDLRKGADGLRALIGSAEAEVLYVFSNRNRDLLKFLAVDAAYVKRQMEALKRKLFGADRSERISDEQLQLAIDELEREIAEHEAVAKEVIGYTRRRPKAESAEARLPEELETVTEEIIPEEVRSKPTAYDRIGEEVTEEIDVLPMKVIRRRIVRPKFKRRATVDAVPFTAPLPPRVVPGGLPAAGLIAFLLVAKYVDHLPLYRLEKSFKQRFGVKLPRQRLCDWIGYAIENWLCIIYHSIRQGLIGGDYLQIDETPIRYLDPDRKGESGRGYLWVYGRPEGDLCFDWSVGRGKPAGGINRARLPWAAAK